MKGCYFVTGTDTEIGKTYAICYLLKKYAQEGLTTLGLKPVAAGSHQSVNEDAVLLKRYANIDWPLDNINPFCFKEPCSPHIAAELEGRELTVPEMTQALSTTMNMKADLCLIEGAGGWYAPLSYTLSWVDLVRELEVPVIFVVGMKLGCLNHAMLTEKALINDGMKIHGWIANRLSSSMFQYEKNLATLKAQLKSPCLEEIKYNALTSFD